MPMRILLITLSLLMGLHSPGQKLIITPLTNNLFIYTTYGDPGDGSLYPANGMYLVTNKGVVMFDTPWDTTQFQPLLDSIQQKHRRKVVICVATHFHSDRTAGLEYYRQKGISTYTTQLTDDWSRKKNAPRAANILLRDTIFRVGQYAFETFYPGKGHSPDNIVLWVRGEKVLYGGCFVKSTETGSIGNLSDANIHEWIPAVQKVQEKFPHPRYIIPGHLGWTNPQSLSHTLRLLKKYQKNNPQ